jgi:hypothetical protein
MHPKAGTGEGQEVNDYEAHRDAKRKWFMGVSLPEIALTVFYSVPIHGNVSKPPSNPARISLKNGRFREMQVTSGPGLL